MSESDLDKVEVVRGQQKEPRENVRPQDSEMVWHEDMWDYYTDKQDLTAELQLVRADLAELEKQSLGTWLGCCHRRAPKLDTVQMQRDKETILAVAKAGCKTSQSVNNDKVLAMIYHRLTSSPERGFAQMDWEAIGFQNTATPYTDLRALGMLGPLHILYLLENFSDVSKVIYQGSQSEMYGFPFVLVSFDMTKIVVQSLREDVLNEAINIKRYCVYIYNQFYIACFLSWYKTWHQQKLKMPNYFESIKAITFQAKDDPLGLMDSLSDLVQAVIHFSSS